ncbi:MAG: hypothetical protein K0B07_00125 [DPANN group archaeon]|nr:hypothetical protein [DPANN group archaeon]
MDKILKKYMSQVVIENAGPDTTDNDELGTDYICMILRIPIAMLTEY